MGLEGIFIKLLNISITTSWLIFTVMLARLIVKKSPKWIFCLLWGIVGIRLLLPVSIESTWSLVPSSETIPEVVLLDEPATMDKTATIDFVVNPTFRQSFSYETTATVNQLQTATRYGGVVWLCGVALLLLYESISCIKMRKRVRVTIRAQDNVYLCDEVATPFILGILRPKIFVPSYMEITEFSCAVAHEKAHLKRGDHLWKPLGYFLLTVYWFNPVIWFAYILFCRDIEMACDEKVIRNMTNIDRKIYSETLLAYSISKRSIAVCPLAFGEVGVKRRIHMILNYKKPVFRTVVSAMAVCLVVAVCFLTNPSSKVNASDNSMLAELTEFAENNMQISDIGNVDIEITEVKRQAEDELSKLKKTISGQQNEKKDYLTGIASVLKGEEMDYLSAILIEPNDAKMRYMLGWIDEQFAGGYCITQPDGEEKQYIIKLSEGCEYILTGMAPELAEQIYEMAAPKYGNKLFVNAEGNMVTTDFNAFAEILSTFFDKDAYSIQFNTATGDIDEVWSFIL